MTYEEPKIKKGDGRTSDEIETHPSYAQIAASRVSGGALLYGSDFKHQHFITISIHRSELHRGLSRDWPHAREEYIEVMLSEAQWAAFVSSLNVGSGVQCTLNHKDMKPVPQIPELKKRDSQFGDELNSTMINSVCHLKQLAKQIEDAKLSEKSKKELLSTLSMAIMGVTSSAKFVADSFSEHMETTKEHAKAEVNAYIQGTITRAGLSAISENAPIVDLIVHKEG